MTDRVMPSGVIGGPYFSAQQEQSVCAAQRAEVALRTQLLKDLTISSFKTWFVPMALASFDHLALCVAVKPDHPEAEKAVTIIEALPDTFQDFEVFFVPWPEAALIA